MRIRKLAEHAGVTVDTLRFYEKKGLIDQRHYQRGENGYRAYLPSALERLELIKHTQAAGFSLSEILELFGLWEQKCLTNAMILAHLQQKQRQVAAKMAELERIQHYLAGKIAQIERESVGTDAPAAMH